jgi:hypothetical protein
MKKPYDTAELLFTLVLSLLALSAIMALTSCHLTVSADGTRTWSLNGEEAARAIIIYSEK